MLLFRGRGYELEGSAIVIEKEHDLLLLISEPAWPGGKALGLYAEGRRFDSPLRLTFLFKKCDLWTLFRDFAQHS